MNGRRREPERLERRDVRPCDKCKQALGPVFHRLRSQPFVVDQQAVRERAGLELMLGGAAPLADVFASNRGLAVETFELDRLDTLLCQACFLEATTVAGLEMTAEPKPAAGGAS